MTARIVGTAIAGLLGIVGIAQAQERPLPGLAAGPITGTQMAQKAPAGAPAPSARADATFTLPDQPAELGQAISATLGKSVLLRLEDPIQRVSIGDPSIADVTLITARELYILGKALGGTNLILWSRSGRTTVIDIAVGMDTARLGNQLLKMLPNERDIRVEAAAGSIVLTGSVSSTVALEHALELANAYVRNLNRTLVLPVVAGGASMEAGTRITVGSPQSAGSAVSAVGARVVNLLRVRDGQQVMLEVKIAEISRSLLDKLGVDLGMFRTNGNVRYSLISSFFDVGAGGILGASFPNGSRANIVPSREDGLIKVLAEPNIVAISGQEGSFLAGGKIFIPVAQANNNGGGVTVTLEEREFGVGVKFLPTVLDNGRINLRVTPEVSDVLQSGLPFTNVSGVTSILPAFSSRRASTTVQLHDGQSLAIGGLIKNNVSEAVKGLPILGEIPILGALFRSTEFQKDRSELIFVVTPKIVRPLNGDVALPTDRFVEPTRSELFLEGRLEGRPRESEPPAVPERQPAIAPGYQLR